MDLAISNWVPGIILAGALGGLLKWLAGRIEQKLETLEANDKAHALELQSLRTEIARELQGIRTEMLARVSVSDFRESTKELHAKINQHREEFTDLRTEVRVRGEMRGVK